MDTKKMIDSKRSAPTGVWIAYDCLNEKLMLDRIFMTKSEYLQWKYSTDDDWIDVIFYATFAHFISTL